MDSKKIQKIQNEIYRKMSAKRKIEILNQMILLGRELSKFKNDTKRTPFKNSKNIRKS